MAYDFEDRGKCPTPSTSRDVAGSHVTNVFSGDMIGWLLAIQQVRSAWWFTRLKAKMEPQKWGLEDEFCIGLPFFLVPH